MRASRDNMQRAIEDGDKVVAPGVSPGLWGRDQIPALEEGGRISVAPPGLLKFVVPRTPAYARG